MNNLAFFFLYTIFILGKPYSFHYLTAESKKQKRRKITAFVFYNYSHNCTASSPQQLKNYEFVLFEDVDEMVKKIKRLDAIYGLCRNIAGYAWEWKSHVM